MLTKEECENSYSNLSVIRELLNINGLLTNTYDKSMVTFASLINEHFEIAKEKECLEKAFDNACELLEKKEVGTTFDEENQNTCTENHCFNTCIYARNTKKEEWKEWLMKNVD